MMAEPSGSVAAISEVGWIIMVDIREGYGEGRPEDADYEGKRSLRTFLQVG